MTLTPDEQLIINLHRDMVNNGRYGEFTPKYEAGKLVTIKKGETLKPGNNNGGKKK